VERDGPCEGWWTIPGERSKNGLDHRVRLSPQAVRILKELHGVVGKSPWVFPSTRKTGPHINHAQKAIERIVDRSKVEFRGHDLRRTAASLMVGAGVPRLVVSKILNHVETGVTAVYDRDTATISRSGRRWTFGGKRLDAIIANKPGGKVLTFEARR
jgi:integrase